jgi:catechol 2,3-dioxygenase-like lactoylglutathione lyase family enzyme
MPVKGIDHVQIAAPPGCEADARRFFGELLGLEEIRKPAALAARGGCWFKLGPVQIHIGVEQDFRPARKAHIALAVDDVDGLFTTLVNAGVVCRRDDDRESVRRFFSEDPWGNRLEFTEPTSATEPERPATR